MTLGCRVGDGDREEAAAACRVVSTWCPVHAVDVVATARATATAAPTERDPPTEQIVSFRPTVVGNRRDWYCWLTARTRRYQIQSNGMSTATNCPRGRRGAGTTVKSEQIRPDDVRSR
jgi:hypothetical protein